MKYNIPEAAIRKQAQKDGVTHFATGVVILREDKVLIVRRVQNDFLGGNYELPGGGVEEGENFEGAVIRETLEETGLCVKAIAGMFEGFDYATDQKPKARQLNFIVEVDSGDVVLSSEHDAFLWIGEENDLKDLPMSDNMKTCLKNVLRSVSSFKDK